MSALLFALPWLLVLLFVLFVARVPSELPEGDATLAEREAYAPLVSVVVPARDEALNIEVCLRSVTASTYPRFEVIVVDDRSTDDTAALARAVPPGRARSVDVVDGEPLPDGWLGKPWACHQGAVRARGELILFTDADTTHHPDLLGRAVAGLREERADLMTVVGRQLMETFWERLVQPQIFLVMLLRFPDFERTARNGRWRDAIANGQFLLFTRAAYEGIGGHEAVRDEVVEDLAMAQRVKRAGLALRMRGAEPLLETRMYRSLAELVAGWSKNLVIGGLQSVARPIRPVVAPVSLASGVVLWLAPPVLLGVALAGAASPEALAWAGTVCALSALTFAIFTHRMRGPWPYGLLYPLGAAVGTYIFLRSWTRGGNVEWKGRSYKLPAVSERA